MCFITCASIYPSLYIHESILYLLVWLPLFLSLSTSLIAFAFVHLQYNSSHYQLASWGNRGLGDGVLSLQALHRGTKRKGVWGMDFCYSQDSIFNSVHIYPSRFSSHHCISDLIFCEIRNSLKFGQLIFPDSTSLYHPTDNFLTAFSS